MTIKCIVIALTAFTLASCGGDNKKEANTEMPMPQHQDSSASKKALFANVKFDLAKDPACNMPISAGVEDTAHYKDKVYGFCSKECKDEFLKDPESFLAKK